MSERCGSIVKSETHWSSASRFPWLLLLRPCAAATLRQSPRMHQTMVSFELSPSSCDEESPGSTSERCSRSRFPASMDLHQTFLDHPRFQDGNLIGALERMLFALCTPRRRVLSQGASGYMRGVLTVLCVDLGRAHAHARAYTRTRTLAHVHAHTYTRTHTRAHIHAHTYTRTRTRASAQHTTTNTTPHTTTPPHSTHHT